MNKCIEALFYLIIIFLLLGFISCKHDMDVPPSPVISFDNDVKPIISTNCTQSGCHGVGSYSEFQLLTYDDIMQFVKTGNDATSCKLYQAVTGKGGEELMPPSPYSALPDVQIKTILLWMKQGAKNN